MLIGLCGGICAGKRTVAQYLADHHDFQHLYLRIEKNVQQDEDSDISQSLADLPFHDLDEVGDLTLANSPSKNPARIFASADALLDFVTKNWQSRWVTTDIHNEAILDKLLRRPFFILISIDAPVSSRWQRYKALASTSKKPRINTLEEFVSLSDVHLYHPTSGLLPLISRATLRLLNTSTSLAHLYATLGTLDLPNSTRLRPTWDQYFMTLASLAARRSNCMKRRVGCVLVHSNRVISTGYNGTPRHLKNCSEGGCRRCNSGEGSGMGLGTCLCLHAEENALLEAGRDRIREGSIIYCDTCPCLTCGVKIAQVGIAEVVYSFGYSMDGETADIFTQAGVKLRQFIPPPDGMIHLEKKPFCPMGAFNNKPNPVNAVNK